MPDDTAPQLTVFRDGLIPALTLYLAVYLLAAALSVSRQLSSPAIVHLLQSAALLLAALWLAPRLPRRWAAMALALFAVLLAIHSGAQAILWFGSGGTIQKFRLGSSDANTIAALFSLMALACLPYAIKRPQLRWMVAGSVLIVFATLSRGAWVGLMAGLTVGWSLSPSAETRHGRFVMPAIIALTLAGLVVAGFQRSYLTSGRDEYWRAALSMFRSSPLIGTGPDTFILFYNSSQPHAHSMLLQAASEAGITGLAAGGWLAAEVVYALWLRRSDPLARGMLSACAGLAVHGLVDTPMWDPWVAGLMVLLLGLALGSSSLGPYKP